METRTRATQENKQANSPLAGKLIEWKRTASKRIIIPLVAPSPHSLGKLIEWKL